MHGEKNKWSKPIEVFGIWNFYHFVFCIFNLLRDYGCIVGLANQSCVTGSFMCSLNCIALHCSYCNRFFVPFFFLVRSIRIRPIIIYLAIAMITPGFNLFVRHQSCFSLGSKTVYGLSFLLKNTMYTSEFHHLFRGATQKWLDDGLRATLCM